MEDKFRWILLAAVAPVLWATVYAVTRHALPAGVPFWGAALRSLPAGLLLLAIVRELPRGAWWWRACVLGLLNGGGFFVLIYVAAQRLPTSVATTVMALSPTVLVLVAWPLLGQRPRARALAASALGVAGVAVLVGAAAPGAIDALGIVASVSGMLLSSTGFVLAARWDSAAGGRGPTVLATTAWQLVAGGALVVPAALLLEGAPPRVDAQAIAGFLYVSFVATALAYVTWFTAIRRIGPATVGLVGLLNPVTGVLLGVVGASEVLAGRQIAGLVLTLGAVVLGLARNRPDGSRGSRGGSVSTVRTPVDA